MGLIILIALILLLVGALPHWPYSRNWGYHPTTGIIVLLVLVLILVLSGNVAFYQQPLAPLTPVTPLP